MTFSLLSSSDNAIVADMYSQGEHTDAIVINYNPATPAAIQIGSQTVALAQSPFSIVPLPSTSSYLFR